MKAYLKGQNFSRFFFIESDSLPNKRQVGTIKDKKKNLQKQIIQQKKA